MWIVRFQKMKSGPALRQFPCEKRLRSDPGQNTIDIKE